MSTACVTAPPKANMASRPLASSFICISSFFLGSEMKPIGSKPVAGRGKGAMLDAVASTESGALGLCAPVCTHAARGKPGRQRWRLSDVGTGATVRPHS